MHIRTLQIYHLAHVPKKNVACTDKKFAAAHSTPLETPGRAATLKWKDGIFRPFKIAQYNRNKNGETMIELIPKEAK